MQDEANKSKKYRQRFSQMKQEVENDWRAHWEELSEYMLPRKGRYLSDESIYHDNRGNKRNDLIINSSVLEATRTLAAGMQGGLTSPSRPWFRLSLADEELMEYQPVKEWLHDVSNIMLSVLQRSNFYSSIHTVYEELGVFGTGAMMIESDDRTTIRFRPYTIGEYYLATGQDYRPDTIYRRFSMTARQIVEKFGYPIKDNGERSTEIDWSNISNNVKNTFERNQGETRFSVVHCIQPNDKHDPASDGIDGMAYESVYYEEKGDTDKLLRKAGYKTRPFVAPRWDTLATDVYGRSPGMDALGDAKMLQDMAEKSLMALDKMINPPMNAPTTMKTSGNPNILPGGINFIDVTQGQQGFTPAYQVSPRFQDMEYAIEQVTQRIRRCFFNDMFVTILNQGKQMTAREVAERHEEKLMMLGSVLERLQSELLDVIITRVFWLMDDAGQIPPMPQELQGNIRIEYISVLAQAQKMVGTSGIEQLAGFVGNLAGVNPEVIDKLDFDEIVDQYGEMLGAPPKIVRSDDAVAELREMRAQAQQQAQMMEQANAAAQSTKQLADAKMGENSALDAVMGGMQ